MAGKTKAKSSKVGRNKVSCARYTQLHKRIRNKMKKLKRHMKSHVADKQASRALRRCSGGR